MDPVSLPVLIGTGAVMVIAGVYVFWARKGSKTPKSE
jgi:hypothetical protein